MRQGQKKRNVITYQAGYKCWEINFRDLPEALLQEGNDAIYEFILFAVSEKWDSIQ